VFRYVLLFESLASRRTHHISLSLSSRLACAWTKERALSFSFGGALLLQKKSERNKEDRRVVFFALLSIQKKAMGSVGVPLKLLHEAVGHVVTVEMKSSEVYRGKLVEAEDSMNIKLASIMYTARNGQTTELEHAFIRGSKIRLVVLPDILKNAPMFKRDPTKPLGASGRGIGRGMGRGGGRGGGFRR
jgi:small nuclear ribonucleoprotein D3